MGPIRLLEGYLFTNNSLSCNGFVTASCYTERVQKGEIMANWEHITKTIVNVDETPTSTKITCDCGHTNNGNQIFHYKIGTKIACYQCSKNDYEKRLKEGK